MPTQQKALIGSLVFIVGHLEDTGKLIPYLHELGRRHRDYGVQSHHYNWVSTSFLKTLSHFFGETWSPELEISWKEALTLIAEKMKAGAAPSEETIAMQIEKALKEMIETTLSSIVDDADIRNFVKTTAQVVLREAIEKEMRDLQNTFKSRHAA